MASGEHRCEASFPCFPVGRKRGHVHVQWTTPRVWRMQNCWGQKLKIREEKKVRSRVDGLILVPLEGFGGGGYE